MAELRTAASAISVMLLGARVAEGVIKLKIFMDKVKNAPHEIKGTLLTLLTLTRMLEEISSAVESNKEQIPVETSSLCLTHCQLAVQESEAVIRDLNNRIVRKRRIGSLRAVLKKGEVEGLKNRLLEAENLLIISGQILDRALHAREREMQLMREAEHRDIMRQIQIITLESLEITRSIQENGHDRSFSPSRSSREHIGVAPSPKSASWVSKRITTSERGISLGEEALVIEVQTPWWLPFTRKAFEFRAYKACIGWKFVFNNYNIVTRESPISHFVSMGDIEAIKDLFQRRLATPNDQNEIGMSIINLAARNQHLDVCRLLLNEGATAARTCVWGGTFSVLEYAMVAGDEAKSPQHHLKSIQLLAKEDDNLALKLLAKRRSFFCGHASVLEWILQQSRADRWCNDSEERRSLALHICSTTQPDMASILKVILGTSGISPDICQMRDRNHSSLLLCAARHLGAHLFQNPKSFEQHLADNYSHGLSKKENAGRHEDSVLHRLLNVISDLVLGGSKLHRRAGRGYLGRHLETPFLAIFKGFFEAVSSNTRRLYFSDLSKALTVIPPPSSATTAMMVWLQTLHNCGVNLEKYGMREKRIHQRDGVYNNFYYRIHRRNSTYWDKIQYFSIHIHFTYGSKPEDWKLWIFKDIGCEFREFWEMVDSPERGMPGAWIECNESWKKECMMEHIELFSDDSESDSDSSEWNSDSE